MKKNGLIIISAAAVVIILGISLFYPPADEAGSGGTIGKVDKYRKSNTSEEGIKLRNDFLKDTTALKTTITTLYRYENYLNYLKDEYSNWETSFEKMNVNDEKLKSEFKQLKDLTVFMNNNLSTVKNTRELLIKYYTKETTDMSVDVQNNLIRFGNFLTNLDEKSEAVDSLFTNLTGMIEQDKLALLKLTKEETDALKEIREKMLAGSFVFATVMGNEERLNMSLNGIILNMQTVNAALNGSLFNLLLITNKEKLGFWNKSQLKMFADKENLGFRNLNQLNLFLDKEKLGMFISNKTDLQNVQTMDAGLAAALGNKKLGALFNLETLGIGLITNKFVFSNEDLKNSPLANSGMLSHENLNNGIWAKTGLGAFNNLAGTLRLFNRNRNQLGLLVLCP